jgi:large subunit ribosomal protein L14
MIKKQTILKIIDNSGVKKILCIGLYKRRVAGVGHIIRAAVQEALPRAKIKKGDVVFALVTGTRNMTRNSWGAHTIFSENYAVILGAKKEESFTRVTKPVSSELRSMKVDPDAKPSIRKVLSFAETVI